MLVIPELRELQGWARMGYGPWSPSEELIAAEAGRIIIPGKLHGLGEIQTVLGAFRDVNMSSRASSDLAQV